METDLERVDSLLAGQEAEVRRAFLDYVKLVQSPEVMGEITTRLESGDLDGAFQIVRSYVARFADVLPRVHQAVGTSTMDELSAILPASIAVAISFDPSNPRAAALVAEQRMGLIREMTDSQLATIQQALNRGLSTGLGAQASARLFRDAIGLTSQQEAAVDSYRLSLELRSRDALTRALRDRRFDGRVLQAIEQNRPLTQRQIDTMVARYRARTLAGRAEAISRTEALQATSEAREEAVEQMIATTGLSRSRISPIWNPTGDDRTRDWHESMMRQRRGPDGFFTDGLGQRLRYPGDPGAPANTRINCRCALTYEIKPAA